YKGLFFIYAFTPQNTPHQNVDALILVDTLLDGYRNEYALQNVVLNSYPYVKLSLRNALF
ncbi:TPA: hypothetical protein ACIFCX_003251, partial [Acinetobacter baumannii]